MKVFLAYSPEDESLKSELDEHLALLQKQGVISVWNTGKIAAGEDIGIKTAEQIRAARIILLLISSDFLASDIIEHPDIKSALAQQHRNDAVRVVPVILRDCVWRVGELAHLQPLPANGYAVTNTKYWGNYDEAFKQIAIGLPQIVADLNGDSYDYPSGKLTETVNDLGQSIWQRYKKFVGAGATALIITISMLYMLIKSIYGDYGNIFNEYQYCNKLEGTWVHTQYFQNMLFIAKLVFRDGNIEVYSKDNGKELYWGKQQIIVKNKAITVHYKDWGLTFQIEPQFEENTDNIIGLVTIYRANDADGVNVVNDTLVRPLLAVRRTANAAAPDNRTTLATPAAAVAAETETMDTLASIADMSNAGDNPDIDQPPQSLIGEDENTYENISTSRIHHLKKPPPPKPANPPAIRVITPVDPNNSTESATIDSLIAPYRPILKTVLDKMTDSMAIELYNRIPVETLSISPAKRIDLLDYAKHRKKN